MLKSLSYYSAVLRHPARRDFIDMGFGIEARFKRSRDFWERHLRLCKEFASDSLKDYERKGGAWILGAGSLLDIDLNLLESKFTEVTLYDANLALKKRWQKSFARSNLSTNFIFKDITGSIDALTIELQKIAKNKNPYSAICNFLSDIKLRSQPLVESSPDIIFSLNLLSQIPIYWRDRVYSILDELCGINTDEQGNYDPQLQSALEESMCRLQGQHLSILEHSGAKKIILITDTEYLYYVKDKSLWQSEKALFTKDLNVQGYSKSAEDSWFWHIAPQGIENKHYGVIHNVKAVLFNK